MNRKLSAIIVDDERLARKDLRQMLSEFKSIDVIGEADHAATAMSLIEQTDPDIIFLDIQMPGESGFEMLEKIKPRGEIIFVTAYDEYAIRAFEVNALDYLLKPVSPTRLKATIDRMLEKPEEHTASKKKLTRDDRLFILFGSGYKFIRISSILYIASSGDYSEVYLTDGIRGLTNRSMQEWEERLPDNTFCRIHRSTIINLDYVSKVEDWFNSTFRVFLQQVPAPFVMSRRYATIIKGRLG
jgi:two-component system LytT family response regulator